MKRFLPSLGVALLLVFGTTISNAQVCTPSVSTCSETIWNVALNTINNNSTGCGTVSTGYSDFTSDTTQLTVGSTYTLSVTGDTNTNINDVVDVWIDYNQDGSFSNSELIGTITGYDPTTTTNTLSFTVPSGVNLNNSLLRVRLRNSSTDASADPCSAFTYGETEDYIVNIQLPVCSGTPTACNITTSTLTTAICYNNTIALSATDPNTGVTGISYQWQSSSSASGPWANVASSGTGLNYTSGSLSDTTYFRLSDSCTASGLTNYSSVFAVPVSVIAPVITTQPTDATVCAGSNTSFSTAATGTYSYQWQVNTGSGFTNLADAGVYSGSATNTLTISGATSSMNGNTYQCIVTDNCAPSGTTITALLTVNEIICCPVVLYVTKGFC